MSEQPHDRRAPRSQWIIQCVGISEEDEAHLRLLLRFARKLVSEDWVWGSESEADLLITDTQSVIEDSDIRLASRRRVSKAQLIEADEAEPPGLFLRRPFNKDAFAALLNAVVHADPVEAGPSLEAAAPLPPPVSEPDANNNPGEPASSPVANPDDDVRRSLLHYLPLRVLGGPAQIRLPDLPPLVIDPETRMFWANGSLSTLEPYVREPLRAGDWKRLASDELEQARGGIEARPYAYLIWMESFVHSKGVLSRRFDPEGTYRLTKRLDLATDYPRALRISAQMSNPRRLDAIARASGAELAEVFDVINAYEAVGYLEWTRSGAAPARRS